MKTVKNSSIRFGLMMIVVTAVTFSCEYTDITPVPDYFPLSETTKTVYKKEFTSTADETVWATDTVTLSVSGDTLIDGISYKKFVNEYGLLEKVVRREADKYFGRNHELYGGFTKEYLFLDLSVPVNGTWEHIKDEGFTKTEYVVKATNSSHVIDDVEYRNVIKVEVNYYDKYTDGVNFELRNTAKHYYADGIGEIYAYYPYPASGMFANLNISILPPLK